MEERQVEGSGILWAVIAGLIFWISISIGVWLWIEKKAEVEDRVVPKKISDRMKKVHGIQVAYEQRGKVFFMRGGKRCEL